MNVGIMFKRRAVFPISNDLIIMKEIVAGPVKRGVAKIEIRLSTFPTLSSFSLSLTVSKPNKSKQIPPAILNESIVIPKKPKRLEPIKQMIIAITNANNEA